MRKTRPTGAAFALSPIKDSSSGRGADRWCSSFSASSEEKKFSPLDRVQQRIWSRSLVLVHVEVLKVFSQDRVLPHRVVFLAALMMDFQGIFALFSVREKVRGWVRTRGRNWVRTLLRPRRLLMWTGICLPPGLTARGSLGGSRSLARGTRPGTLLFGGDDPG